MSDRPVADTSTPARTALEILIIDPETGLPIAPSASAGGATAAKQDEQTGVLQDILAAATDTATINVAQDTSVIKNGSTSLTPKFAAISSTGSGDTLALVASKKIRVLSMFFVVAGATTVKFQSGGATDKTGAMSFAANGGISLPFNPTGWFETAAGEKLNHVLGSAVAIAGGLTYVEI